MIKFTPGTILNAAKLKTPIAGRISDVLVSVCRVIRTKITKETIVKNSSINLGKRDITSDFTLLFATISVPALTLSTKNFSF